jgi:putative hydrolase of the HAD superfamily
MPILALDVDGVVLDPDRAGTGHWSGELERRYGITRPQLRQALFADRWVDVVEGRRDLRDALGVALDEIGTEATVDDVMTCWFDADFVVVEATIELAGRVAESGIPVVLATNQEHWRAAFLAEQLGRRFPLHDVVYSAALGAQKHDPAFYDAASARLGVSAAQRGDVVFADDDARNVDCAVEAGWRAHLVTPTNGWIEAVVADLGLA